MSEVSSTIAITGRDLIRAGWTPGPAIGKALAAVRAAEGDTARRLTQLESVHRNPDAFVRDVIWQEVAEALVLERKLASTPDPPPLGPHKAYPVWGSWLIDAGAREQMDVAMRLPVSVRGALMPDAHVGYGLPIGGVLETKDSVIPYAVGSDIACRMRLTILDADASLIDSDHDRLKRALVSGTVFGAGKETRRTIESAVLDENWSATPLLKSLKDLAHRQIGTSGSGNHFVEWGAVDWQGRSLLALMSHSGSRGVGFKIAAHYSKLAESIRVYDLPPEAIRLSWLELDSPEGQEYWTSMELAGRFASANHATIHQSVVGLSGLDGLEMTAVENHHNFAWLDTADDGSRLVLHRKGATPAGPGVMGVIPGSMGTPGYVVTGRGNPESLESASHGAGRAMGRRQAERVLTREDRDRILKEGRITLIGGGLDESPQAYKNIEDVIAAQSDLVEVTARFTPRIVRMDTGSQDI